MHSIHYIDLIRQILGNPLGVHAKTLGHPNHKVAQTRTSAILDYGDSVRCSLSVNHDHKFGRKFQACEFRICGTEGAAYVKLGVNLDYPRGEPDELDDLSEGRDPTGSTSPCRAHGFQTHLSGAWPICSASPAARTRSSSVPSRMHGTQWRWSRRPISRARRRRRRSHRSRRPECPNKRSISRTMSSAMSRLTTGRTITETDFVVHAGHTGDFFPHHMDAEFAKTTPFGQRVAHGTMIFSIGVGLTASLDQSGGILLRL